MKLLAVALACNTLAVVVPAASAADAPSDARAVIAAQRTALDALAMFDGTWRGPATVYLPDGKRIALVQTERVGPMLDGSIRVVEGRGHDAAGEVVFNALGIISYAPRTKAYSLRSYARGQANDFPLERIENGFEWSIQAGPAVIRYRATVRDGEWHETGERVVAGQAPVKMFEMRLRRLGDSPWPSAGVVPPRD